MFWRVRTGGELRCSGGLELGCSGGLKVLVPLVITVVLLLNDRNII